MADYTFGIGEELQFTSQDTDLIHEWNFGDGIISDLPNPSHIYLSPDTYIVTHSARDFCDTCSISGSHTIEITLASITVKSILLDKYTAKVGDIITVTVIVQNLSPAFGSSTISIDFGGDILGPYNVTLSPGQETTLTVQHQVIISGMIDVCADNVCTALFVEPNISVTSLTIDPSISTGQIVNATIEVKNTGQFTEEKTIRTTLTNTVTIILDERLVSLAPAETQSYTILIDSHTLPNGSYTICADSICKAMTIAIPTGVGNLNIETVPQGANIFIDDINRNTQTNTIINDVPSGDRLFRLTLPNYNDTTGIVTIISGTTSYIYLSLTPLETTTGSVAISSIPTNADIYIDDIQQLDQFGQPLRTPATISGLSPINHSISIKLSGYMNYDIDVDIEVGITKYITAILLQAPILVGNINFTTVPDGAEIWLAPIGQPLVNRGTTPRTIPDLDIGNYDFELRLIGYNNLMGQISVLGGTTSYVYATMVPISPLTGSISISSMPPDAEIFIAPEGGSFTDTDTVTPDTITDLDPGNYTIKLTRTGYNDAETTIIVIAGQTTYIGMTLIVTRAMEAGIPWWFLLSLSAGTVYGMMKPEKVLRKMV